jgi:hypothetical protein
MVTMTRDEWRYSPYQERYVFVTDMYWACHICRKDAVEMIVFDSIDDNKHKKYCVPCAVKKGVEW